MSLIVFAGLLTPVLAQYPGHIDAKKKPAQTARAIAVLEWTGEPGKPSASRLIPLSIFDGEQLQPGGLYLARPEPLALESGTEYVLQHAGVPQGVFDIYGAHDVQGYWFGYGAWKPLTKPPAQKKAEQGKLMPQVVTQPDSDRPHFKGKQPENKGGAESDKSGSDKGGSGSDGSQPASKPKPGEQSKSGSGTSTQSGSAPNPSDGGGAPKSDPDRPTLRRRPDAQKNSGSNASVEPETAVNASDPDRPRLTRGRQASAGAEAGTPELTTTPLNLEQMVAVSDAADHDPHPFAYSWANPGDAAKMQAQMETIAKQAIVAANSPAKPATTRPASATRSTAQRSATAQTRAARQHATTPAALPELTDERFAAYELTYSGGATLVFSAKTASESAGQSGPAKYVTVVAQPDFYGTPLVIFKQVTSDATLDATPRMRLIDAVDTNAHNRGDLVFELRSSRDRQFVIDRVSGGRLEQIFTTGPLPDERRD